LNREPIMNAMLARLKIGPKLLLAPAAVLLLLVFSSCSSYIAMLSQNRAFEAIVYERAARIKDAGELLGESQQAHANVYQLLTWMGASFSGARVQALVREIRQRHVSIARRFEALARAGAGADEQRLLALGREAFAVYLRDVRDVLELAQQDHSLSANAMSKAERSFDVVERHLGALALLEQALSERAQREAKADFDAAAVLMPGIVALSVMLTGAITMAVRGALLKELAAIGKAARGLGAGDLSVPRRAYGRDEISETSRALDASIRNLNKTLRDIRAQAEEVDDDSRDLAEDQALLSRQAESMSGPERQRVRDAAMAAEALQRQALALSRAVSAFRLDETAPPELRLAGGLEEPPAVKKGHLHLASVKPTVKQ
jgi:methyl-accepting chemotaxis protein